MELVRLGGRLLQDLQDRLEQLHRVVDLTFPAFTRHVKTHDGALAVTLLGRYPTAWALAQVAPGKLPRLVTDGRHHAGPEQARASAPPRSPRSAPVHRVACGVLPGAPVVQWPSASRGSREGSA